MGPAPVDGEVRSSFFTALYAPYADTPLPRPPRLPRTFQSRCNARVDWTVRPALDTSSSDEEDDEMNAPKIPGGLLEQPAYTPVNKWLWTQNQPLSDAVTLRHISGALSQAL